MFASKNQLLCGLVRPVLFDAVGGGAFGQSANFSWSHTGTAGSCVIADVVSDRANAIPTLTYGGSNMMWIGTSTMPGGNSGAGFVARYILANIPGGSQTISVSGVATWEGGSSVSYVNANSINIAAVTSGTGTSATQSSSCSGAAKSVQAFGCAITSGTSDWTSTSGGTNRYNQSTPYYSALAIGDGSGSTTFTATAGTSSTDWSGINNILSPARSYITYDSAGAGNTVGNASSLSWSHTIAGNAVLVGINIQTGTPSGVTAQVGSTPMTNLGVYNYYGGTSPTIIVFGLLSPPTGSQTITVTTPAGSYLAANSVSYFGVHGFGGNIINGNATSSASLAVPSALSPSVFQVFGTGGVSTPVFGSYNQTSRWSIASTANSGPILIGDASGIGGVTFSATQSSGNYWGGMAVPLF